MAELKLDGNKDEELYRELLLAQCHALNQVMPLLFEQVSDESELLLPDNLTKTDSLIRDLVEQHSGRRLVGCADYWLAVSVLYF